MTLEENNLGGPSTFSVPHINTNEQLRNDVELVVREWVARVGIYEQKIPIIFNPTSGLFEHGPPCVMEFLDAIKTIREKAHKMRFTGAVSTPDEMYSWSMEIPGFLDTLMVNVFGSDWKLDEKIWKTFKDVFRAGLLNPNPKRLPK